MYLKDNNALLWYRIIKHKNEIIDIIDKRFDLINQIHSKVISTHQFKGFWSSIVNVLYLFLVLLVIQFVCFVNIYELNE